MRRKTPHTVCRDLRPLAIAQCSGSFATRTELPARRKDKDPLHHACGEILFTRGKVLAVQPESSGFNFRSNQQSDTRGLFAR